MLSDLWQLFRVFGKIGLYAYGGGPAMLPVMQAEVVHSRAWITDADFRTAMAISYSLPGPLAPQMALFVGWRIAGWPGAAVASFAVVLPGLILMAAFVSLFWSNAESAYLKGAAKGAGTAVIGLLAYITYDQAYKVFVKSLNVSGWWDGVSAHPQWVVIVVVAFAGVMWRPQLMMPLTIAAAAVYGAFYMQP